jgi:transcriptional regulator of acetoin/glycerol metabolism
MSEGRDRNRRAGNAQPIEPAEKTDEMPIAARRQTRWDGRDSLAGSDWVIIPGSLIDGPDGPFHGPSTPHSAQPNRLLYRATDGGSLPASGASQPPRQGLANHDDPRAMAERHHDNDHEPTGSMARTEETMLTTQKAMRHASLVESAVQGLVPASDINHRVRHSWARCIETYALDPLTPKKATVVDRPELQARREQHGLLLSIARIELLSLRKRLHQNDFGIMLTDQDGVILHYVGDPGFAATAKRSGLREGAVWSERELGTNGMGTCIVEQRSVVIHQNEHFLAQNTELTCSATPIFDSQGKVVAALDISGSFNRAQTHTLALVEIAAQNIENRALLESCKRHYMLRFHRQQEFISTPGEGIVAFDDNGMIVGANRSALELLGAPDHRALCGQALEAVFDTTLATQMQLASRRAFRPAPLLARASQTRLWSAIQPPERELRAEHGRRDHVELPATSTCGPLAAMEYGDPQMANNVRIVRRVLDRNIPVLLLGETGTGKGCFAKAIHAASRRADKPFVTVNCAAIPETLIESELFGYKAGAFTGATREGHSGRVVQANGGTLFLDEIGDMPLPLQVRLLSVIEDREVIPLGASKAIPVDIRIISATHCDLLQQVRERRFREDLYYRLNGLSLRMPALRDRHDSRDLILNLIREESRDRDTEIDINDAAMRRLLQSPWPGNIRQLRNVLRTMIAMSENDCLTLADFDEEWLSAGTSSAAPAVASDAIELDLDGDDVLGEAEREALRRVLECCRWNVSAAAVQLHVSRKTLYRKMFRHGITRREGVAAEHHPRASAESSAGDG